MPKNTKIKQSVVIALNISYQHFIVNGKVKKNT